ncbi:GAF domain-containing protein [Lysobacter sp. BMK333-48F3]|uniref:GAF domain-containing protein n=1 Tax=Lysobacter sp. BMK333-48F3 TaxID=2867962 RepID=UPI001C8C1DAD|nr:GAF domain-containing protein [Lysobacter sp. BMK333-48F3]MBX9400531.1 GAF domain-containing protein [Lysobacter sp. BMK333-48F3]
MPTAASRPAAAPPSAIPESERQRALDRLRIVDSLPEPVYDDLVKLAATVCDTPIALVSLIDRDRQWFKARVGLDDRETARSVAVCDHAIRSPGALLEVPDLARDPRFADLPVVENEIARFYAGAPLVTDEGVAIGTVCVLDNEPRELEPRQRQALESLSRIAMELIDAHAREHQAEVGALLAKPAAAEPPAAAAAAEPYTVAILELQNYAGTVERLGERATEKAMETLGLSLEHCLRPELGDHIDRVTSSPEFVATLSGGDVEARIEALRGTVERHRGNGLTVLLGSAAASSAEEAPSAVFLRADAALSREKNRLKAA